MKSVRYLIFTCCILLLLNVNVYAKACDSSDISRLREIANDIEVNYVFNVDYENDYGEKTYDNFNLEVIGITDEVYIYFDEDMNEIFTYKDTNNGNLSFNNYFSGEYKVFVASKNCGNLLREIEVDIPRFNKYSLDDRCKKSKYSNLDICDEWYRDYYNVDSTNLDYYFYGEQDSFSDKIINFINNNLILVACIGIVLVVFIIIFILKQRKRWSLE